MMPTTVSQLKGTIFFLFTNILHSSSLKELLKEKERYEDLITWAYAQGVVHPNVELYLKPNPVYGNAAFYANKPLYVNDQKKQQNGKN